MVNRILLLLILFFNIIILKSQPCDIPFYGYDCESAPILCDLDDLDGFCTTMPDFSNPTGPPTICNGSGLPNNSIWFGFVASSKFVNLTVIPKNCSNAGGQFGLQGGIYSGSCNNVQSVVCQENCTVAPMNLQSNNFKPGDIYWIMIDGCNGSFCDITIDIDAGGSVPLGSISNIMGAKKACTSGVYEYSVNPVQGATYYYWYLNGELVDDPESLNEKVPLNFDTAGVFELCVDVANYCIPVSAPPSINCIDITVSESSVQTFLPPVKICARDTIYIFNKPYSTGIHDIVFTNSVGCDSIITVTIDSIPIPITELGIKYLCKNECYVIQDTFGNSVNLCDTVTNKKVYLQSWTGCDSIINVTIKHLQSNPVLIPDGLLNCQDSIVIINNQLNIENADSITFQWLTTTGNIISSATTKDITVNEPGEYCVFVSMKSPDGKICIDSACTFVVLDTSILQAGYYFTGDTILTCSDNVVEVVATSTPPFQNAYWQFNSQQYEGDTLQLSTTGILTLITQGTNGCGNDTLQTEIKSSYFVKQSINIDSSICFGKPILIDSIPHGVPDVVKVFEEINGICTVKNINLINKNQADTLLIRCDGEALVFFDKPLKDTVIQVINIENQTGCDSVWIVKIKNADSETDTLLFDLPIGSVYHDVVINKDTVLTEYFKNYEGCDSTVVNIIEATTSTNYINTEIQITIIPNPARDQITLLSKSALSTYQLNISNSLGQSVIVYNDKSDFPVNIDISGLQTGIYWINLSTNKGFKTMSFIKRE